MTKILIRSEQKHVIISRIDNEALTLATEEQKHKQHIGILISLVETNRNLHWPLFDYTLTVSYITKPISGTPRFISMFRVITE